MIHLEVTSPAALTDAVVRVIQADEFATSLVVRRGAALDPPGDLVSVNVPREAADALIHALLDTGVQEQGSLHVHELTTWVSRPGFEAELEAPGAGSDAIVWPEVVQRAYDESQLSWSFLTFMTLATLIAGIAIILDSQILVIGAMVLGPEFGAIAALGIALLRHRPTLLRQAVTALAVGFAVAIAVTTLVTLVGRALGWVTVAAIQGPRPGTAFIYTPDKWSFIVSLIAGVAGVLSMASGRTGALVGVFISVTTIPAAGNVALALAFADWREVGGSAAQLGINIAGMALAGWTALLLQQKVWDWSRARRWRAAPAADHPSDAAAGD